jgi:hypothetical protein
MKYTNPQGLPDLAAQILAHDDYDRVEGTISATTLIGPPKIHRLFELHKDELELDVASNFASFVGTGVHYYIESFIKAIRDDVTLSEERVSMDLGDGVTLTGKPDLLLGTTLHDFKTTSVWTLIYESRLEEWEKQLNIYAYLLSRNGYPVTEIKVQALLKDWSKSQAEKKSDYPQLPWVEIDIPLWEDEKIQRFLSEQSAKHVAHSQIEAQSSMAHCSPEERWASPTKYAVMKEGRKSAVKLYDTEADALAHANDEGPKFYVEVRPGKSARCEGYCPVAHLCEQHRETKNLYNF